MQKHSISYVSTSWLEVGGGGMQEAEQAGGMPRIFFVFFQLDIVPDADARESVGAG